MDGQAIVDLVTKILGGDAPDETYILQLINLSKMKYERKRPWKVLVALDKADTVSGSSTYLVAHDTPDNFRRYVGESSLSQGLIILFDGANDILYLTEVPFEKILEYKDEFGHFAVDYGSQKFYITGIVPGNYKIYQYFIQKTDPITLATSWGNFDSDYHPILAFDAAAHWRLGTDWDDVNARNADDNGRMADQIYEAMASEDAEMAISAVNNIDYPVGNNRGNTGIGPRGVRG